MKVSTALKVHADRLASTSPTPRLDTEILLSYTLNVPRSYLHTHPEHPLSLTEQTHLHDLTEQRQKNIPIAYLTGKQAFWSFDLIVTPDTLIPRPETELLVELALAHNNQSNALIADLGTGSGAIALAIAHEKPHWQIYATDISLPALKIASMNAQRLNLTQVAFSHGFWYDALPPSSRFDMIISNPPYIDINDTHLHQGALPHEPQSALVSPKNGLYDIDYLIHYAKIYLKKNGLLLLEHGHAQAEKTRSLFSSLHYREIKTYRDLAGLERVTLGRF